MTSLAAALAGLYLTAQIFALAGTLVVAVPTRDGLVVAADSRGSIEGYHFDNRVKLRLANTQPPIVIAITGTSSIVGPPPHGVPLREWFPVAPPDFDVYNVVERAIAELRVANVAEAEMTQVGSRLAARLNDFFVARPTAAIDDESTIVLFQAHNSDRLIFGTTIVETRSGRARQRGAPIVKWCGLSALLEPQMFGQSDYVVEHVQNGIGRQFLPVLVTNLAGKTVRDVGQAEGWRVANAIINAAARTAELIPPRNGQGIGGPVRGYLLTPRVARPLP